MQRSFLLPASGIYTTPTRHETHFRFSHSAHYQHLRLRRAMLASAAASYTSFLLPCTSLASATEINAIVLQCQKRAAHMITRVLSFLMMMFSPHGGFFVCFARKAHQTAAGNQHYPRQIHICRRDRAKSFVPKTD